MQRKIWYIIQEHTVLTENLTVNAKIVRMTLFAVLMIVKKNRYMELSKDSLQSAKPIEKIVW
uniref:Uncharacterized protein n=1 Tax=Pithovirus LCPAC404 TaxID=2506597 RepID=A0A481ZEB7_9VIRU|nr:MAG: hypothetical protein LCPAC404_02960 [Pithovirus LCPAC404]